MVNRGPASPEVNAARYPYGTQPAMNIIWSTGMSIAKAAKCINVHGGKLYCTLRGGCRVSEEIRSRLPELLQVPLTELFTADALDPPTGHTARRIVKLQSARAELDALLLGTNVATQEEATS